MPPGDRLVHLDIIRGLALFGVLIVNLENAFRIPLLERILGLGPEASTAADRAVDLVVARGLEFKALTIFSLLFGAGVARQSEQTASGALGFLVRRLGWLFLLGLLHMMLLWNGDILALYAVSALILLPAVRLPWPATFVIGAAILTAADAFTFRLPLPQRSAAAALIEEARRTYSDGGYNAIAQFRWRETRALIVPLLAGVLPRTAGLMFWGMAAWRSGILREPAKHRRKLVATLGVGLPLGLANPSMPALLAFAYLAGLLLLLTPKRASSLPGLAAVGRMALTNYLSQSVVLGLVFYGYGLGLFGQIGPAPAFCIGLVLFSAQVVVSRAYLARYRFGPVEWAWRRLSYGTRLRGRQQFTSEGRRSPMKQLGAQHAIPEGYRAFEKAFHQGDADAISLMYTEDAQWLIPDGPIIRGREAISDGWKRLLGSGGNEVSVEILEIQECGDWAYDVGRFTVTGPDANVLNLGKYIVIWTRQSNGEWKIHRDIANGEVMPEPAGKEVV